MRGDPKAATVYYDDNITYTGSPGSVNNPMIIEDFWDLIESTPAGLKSINDLEYFNYRRYCKFVNDIDFNDYPEILDGFMDNNFPLLDGSTTRYGYFIRFTDIDGNGCSLRNLSMIKYNKSAQDLAASYLSVGGTLATELDAGSYNLANDYIKMSFLTLFVKKGITYGGVGTYNTCMIKNLNVVNLIMFQCRDQSVTKCDGCFGVASYTYTYSGTNPIDLFSNVGIKFDSCNFGVYINGDSSFRSIFRGEYGVLGYDSKDYPLVTLVRCTVNLKGVLSIYNSSTTVMSNHTKQIFDVSNIKIMYCHLNYNILNLMQTPGHASTSKSLIYTPSSTSYSTLKVKSFGFNYITGNFKILHTAASSFEFYLLQSSNSSYGLYMDNCYINANIILYGTTTTTNAGEPLGYTVKNVYGAPANLSACFVNLSKIIYYSSYLNRYVNTPTSISTTTEQTNSKMYLLQDSQCKDHNYLDSIGFLVIPAT